jgi:hypothetical protein
MRFGAGLQMWGRRDVLPELPRAQSQAQDVIQGLPKLQRSCEPSVKDLNSQREPCPSGFTLASILCCCCISVQEVVKFCRAQAKKAGDIQERRSRWVQDSGDRLVASRKRLQEQGVAAREQLLEEHRQRMQALIAQYVSPPAGSTSAAAAPASAASASVTATDPRSAR